MIVSILIFLLIFSVIVVGHEFGHFAVARRCGIRVKEFDVGMGPALFRRKGKETEFCIRLFPIGGACIFDGMEEMYDPDSIAQAAHRSGETAEEETPDAVGRAVDVHSYPNASVGARIATVLGGPIANFIIGLIFAVIIVAFCGTDLPVIHGIVENSAAEEAGLAAGDVITAINGEPIHIFREIALSSSMSYGESMRITYERDGQKNTVVLTPRYNEEAGSYYIGIIGSGEYVKCGPLQTFQYGFYEAEYWVRATFQSIGLIFRGHFSADDLSGPVGIVKVVDDTYEVTRQYGVSATVLTFMSLTTLLSINLGIMNLLPIPALDGGRFLLLLVELIRGKKLSPEKEGYVTLAGVVILMAIMVFALVNDIGRFFR